MGDRNSGLLVRNSRREGPAGRGHRWAAGFWLLLVGVLLCHVWSQPALAQSQPTEASDPPSTVTSTVVASTVPPSLPVADSGVVDSANLAIQIAVAIIGVLTLVMLVAAFFGVTEAWAVRRTHTEIRESAAQVSVLKSELEVEVHSLESELEALVQVTHLFHEGQVAYGEGDYRTAIRYFDEARGYQPDNVRILTRLARCYTNLDQTRLALTYLERALRINPSQADALRALAACHRYEDIDRAIELSREAIEAGPDDFENWNYAGLLYRERGDIREAISFHQEARRQNGGDPLTHFYLAILHSRLGETAEARAAIHIATKEIDALEEIRKIKPLWADVLRWGRAHLTGDTEEAKRICERLASAAPEQRNVAAVCGHISFVLDSDCVDDTDQVHPYLGYFPREVVLAVIDRSGGRAAG